MILIFRTQIDYGVLFKPLNPVIVILLGDLGQGTEVRRCWIFLPVATLLQKMLQRILSSNWKVCKSNILINSPLTKTRIKTAAYE